MYVCLNRGTTGGSLPFEQFVQLAADAGFDGVDVELDWTLAKGAAALDDLFRSKKLRFGGWGPGVDHRTEPSKRREGLEKLGQHAKIARELSIDSCATWIMPSSDLPFMQTWRQTVEGLRPVAKVLTDHGLRFGLEFVGPYHLRRMFKHEFIYSPGLMLELAAEIGPNCGLLVDSFHCFNAGMSSKHLSELTGDKIVLCHLNDAPKVPLPEQNDQNRLLPGEGVIDLPAFLAALKTAGYMGPISLETFNAVKDLPPSEAAKRAWAATRKVLTASGVA